MIGIIAGATSLAYLGLELSLLVASYATRRPARR
jgi:hypothetical protein